MLQKPSSTKIGVAP